MIDDYDPPRLRTDVAIGEINRDIQYIKLKITEHCDKQLALEQDVNNLKAWRDRIMGALVLLSALVGWVVVAGWIHSPF